MKILSKDGYILAAITGTLYMQSFMGLVAQSVFYGIPLELLTLDVMRVAYTSMLFSVIFIGFFILYLYYIYFKKSRSPNYLRFMWLFSVFSAPVLMFFMFKDYSMKLATILPLLWFGFHLYLFKRTKKHMIDIFTGKSWHYDDDVDDGFKYAFYQSRYLLIGLLLFLIFPGMFLISYVNYIVRSDYDVFYKEGSFAVISYSSDNIIAKKIKNHQLEDGYYIFKTESIESKVFIKRKIQQIPDVAPSGSPAAPARRA